MMLKKLFVVSLVSAISACAPVVVPSVDKSNGHTHVGISALSSVPSPQRESSVGTLHISHTELTAAGKRVHIKPVSSLKRYNGCVEVIVLSYRANLPYENAMIELRNRGGLMGANAVGISDFAEINGVATRYVGHFYKCSNLSKI
jgi:hypothetical protein